MKQYLQIAMAWLKKKWRRYQGGRWFIVITLLVILIISALGTLEAKTTDVSDLKARLQQSTIIYDENNNEAGSLAGHKGTYVELDAISPHVVDAVIATEDRRFYQEYGFSVPGMVRGGVTTVLNKVRGVNAAAGGSTLTQQLVKNAFLTQDQTLKRKVRELFLAIQVEQDYSKDDILTMYLNNAYFGRGAWGVQDAAQKYFGIDAKDLSVDQAAMIAGMLQSPGGYDPVAHPEAAQNRRNQVLQNMVNTDKLKQEDADTLKMNAVGASDHDSDNSTYNYPSYFDAVINEAINRYDISETKLLNDGYQIYTSLNQQDQENLQNNYENPNLDPLNGQAQAASVVMDAQTGGVRAVVGGRGEHVFRGFNRATQMKRSPGSTIKPIVDYAPALSRGFGIESKLKNEVTSFGSNRYTPYNAGEVMSEPVPMYQALEMSYNIPAVWLLDQMGAKVGYDAAKKVGLSVTEDDNNLSLGLGGMEKGTSPLELAQAYTSFANDGQMSEAHFITKIVDATGKTVVEHKDKKTEVWSKSVADDMTAMMLGVYTHGTGVSANPSGYKVAGKTGTTEVSGEGSTQANATDAWAVAYTPDVVVVTWNGFDKTNGEQNLPIMLSATAGPLMKATLEQVIPNTNQTPFTVQGIHEKISQAEEQEQNGLNKSVNDIGTQIQDGADSVMRSVESGARKVWDGVKGLFGS
jgi:penicillin-binding protein 2A